MCTPSPHTRLFAVAFALTSLVALPACTVEAGDDAAHAIAEKFAADGEPQRVVKSSAPAPSQSQPAVIIAPLAPTAASAAQPSPKTPPKSVATPSRDAEPKKRTAAKAEAARRAKEQREADERDVLERAWAESQQRRLEMEKRLLEAERAEAEAAAESEQAAARRIAEEAERQATKARRIEEEEARRAAEVRRMAEERATEQRRAEETRRLAEQAETEARKAAEIKRIAMEEEARRAAEERRLVEKRQREEEERQVAAARRMAAERVLAEEEARRAAEARALAEVAEQRRKAEVERLARESAEAEERERVAALDKIARENMERLAAEREEEARRLSEKLRLARDSKNLGEAAFEGRSALGGPRQFEASSDDGVADVRESGTRVTVLLVMQPGNRGIRRFNKTADPILCINGECYVSRGASEAADMMGRGRAFGPGVAMGARAGMCSHSLTCVFRDIDLYDRSALAQPIDLRILRHDRRQPMMIEADGTCRVTAGRLSCRRPVLAGDYMLWVVPERIAEKAGGVALEAAVRSGLAVERAVANY